MDKYVLVEHLSTIKTAICETFQNTQRIKLSSFDVSSHYIIFGTSSGGIYIFKRKPCEFLRLIPSKEGPTIQVKICPNEKNIAIATSKGLVIILENYFVDFNIRPFLFTEHESNTVTVISWHGNDLYCGDSTGKVSVCTLLSTLTQAIFQCPSSTLMHLDSGIIQIEAFKNYLLISTKTRTYLCDTEKEQYKQIGKKLRDGNFGACFSQTDTSDYLQKNQGLRKPFKTLEEKEHFDNSFSNNEVKIYCSRPGTRLWAVDFEASVLTTYQFRHSLNQHSFDLIVIDDDKDIGLNILNVNPIEIPNSVNFSKVFPVHPNIIVTYDNQGIYFLNLETSSLVCWSNIFRNIKDIKMFKPYIYIWRNDLQIDIVSLYSLEELLISTLLNKQYFLCAEMCNHFNQDVLNLVGKSKKVNLLSVLDMKLIEMGKEEVLEKIKNILDKLKKYYCVEQKLENGIIVVDDQYLSQNLPKVSSHEGHLTILHKQYVLNKINETAELSESSKILNNLQLNDLPSLFETFIKYVHTKNEEDASLWCKQQMVKLAAKQCKNLEHLEKNTIEFLSEAFLELNNFQNDCCKCKFPLPSAHTRKLEHFDLGCKLYEFSEMKINYLYNIPFLFKFKISNLQDITSNISLLVQFSDKEVFKKLMKKITFDSWEDILKVFIKLGKKQCLNCNENIPLDGILSWTEMGVLMMESIGAKNTIKLLKRYAQFIPGGKLDIYFYQSCIFSMTCENRGLGVQFIEGTKNTGNLFGDNLEQFLQKKYLGNQSQSSHDSNTPCSYCHLPLDNPMLVDLKKCECGLIFHQICFVNNNNICKFCINLSSS